MRTNTTTQTDAAKTPGPAAWRALLLLALVAAAVVTARWFDLGQQLDGLRGFVEELGPWGPWAFLLIYVLAVVAAVPGAPITVAAGTLFGSVLGLLLVSAGSTIGASLAFLIARYAARRAVEARLGGNPRFRRLDALTQRHGALMVAVVRLVPLFPFNLVNYGFGLTRVPFWTYVFWSWLAMLPVSAVYVVGADAVAAALADGRVPWPLIVALVALLFLALTLGQVARRRLRADGGDPP